MKKSDPPQGIRHAPPCRHAQTTRRRAARLAPLYDVLSAHAVLGKGRNQLAPERARMAMAAQATNRHYLWKRILPRHWDATAHRCGLSIERAHRLREALAERAPAAVEQVMQELPGGFPGACWQAWWPPPGDCRPALEI